MTTHAMSWSGQVFSCVFFRNSFLLDSSFFVCACCSWIKRFRSICTFHDGTSSLFFSLSATFSSLEWNFDGAIPWDFLGGEDAVFLSSLQENGDEGDSGSLIAIVFFACFSALPFLFRECFRTRRLDFDGSFDDGSFDDESIEDKIRFAYTAIL